MENSIVCNNPVGSDTALICKKCSLICPGCRQTLPSSNVPVYTCLSCKTLKDLNKCIVCSSNNNTEQAFYCQDCAISRNISLCPVSSVEKNITKYNFLTEVADILGLSK